MGEDLINEVSTVFTSITIDGTEYRLRFPGRVQISIEKNSAKELFGQNDRRYTTKSLLQFLDQTEVQGYLLLKGIQGGMPECSKMTMDEALDLRDKYLVSDELDSGERLEEFQMNLVQAIMAAEGADPKKLQEKKKKQDEETELARLVIIEKAKLKAMEEVDYGKYGIGK